MDALQAKFLTVNDIALGLSCWNVKGELHVFHLQWRVYMVQLLSNSYTRYKTNEGTSI